MLIDSNLKITTTSSLSNGDVFVANFFGQACLCLMLLTDGPKPSIAILKADTSDRQFPLWLDLTTTIKCLSYGSECVLEPVSGPETTPGLRFDGQYSPGVLALYEDDSLVMQLSPYDNFAHTEIGYDLRKKEFSQHSSYTVGYFAQWRLWASKSDMRTSGTEPLMEFQFTQP